MRIWFDTEFIEDGRTIDLISVGMVREDGKRLYMENGECDFSRACPWVTENVLSKLDAPHDLLPWSTPIQMRERVRAFAGAEPEFWAWYGAYDWVALCQLFGRMVDLPEHWPKYCCDLKQLVDSMTPSQFGQLPEEFRKKIKLPEQTTPKHHALNDALWTRDAHLWLTEPGAAIPLQPLQRANHGGDL